MQRTDALAHLGHVLINRCPARQRSGAIVLASPATLVRSVTGMKRREFVAILASAAVARPLTAQQKPMPVIGVLGSGSPDPDAPFLAAFLQGLGATGYVEGQNVSIEYRWAETRYERLPALAADLVARKVEVIAALGGTPSAVAAMNATSTIPIIFGVGDPVASGLVGSLAHPDRNLTGISDFITELMPKRLELLSEVVPRPR